MTLAVYALLWLAQLPHRVSPRTVQAYRGTLDRHLLPAFGDSELASISRRDIRTWCQRMLATHQPNTVSTMLTCMQALLSSAVDDELLEINVAHGAAKNLWRIELKPRRLSPDQLSALLMEASKGPKWFYSLVFVLVRTGLRRCEVLGLQAGDLHDRRLHVRRQYRGAGRVVERTKSGPSRWVDLSSETAKVLAQRVDVSSRPRRWLFQVGEDWPVTPSALQQRLRRTAARAGLPPGTRCHDLRHTYSAMLLELGAPLDYIRSQLGHASLTTTRRYVLGAEPPPSLDIVDRLDGDSPERHRLPPLPIRPQLRLVRRPSSGER